MVRLRTSPLLGVLGLSAGLLLAGCAIPGDGDGEAESGNGAIDDPEAVAEEELRVGGIDKVLPDVPEDDLASIVASLERLEAGGHPAEAVETFAVARVLEAARRARASEGASVTSTTSRVRPLGYLWDHLKLNAEEGALCRSRKVTCIKTLFVAHRAKSRSRDLYADGEQGGRRDAFRHSFWNARMVHVGGARWAKAFADAHENGYPESLATPKGRLFSEMDFFNNDVGRSHGERIADEDDVARALVDAVTSGLLKAVRFDPTSGTGVLVTTDTCTPALPCGV
jgi:hypothetical protein